MEKSAKAEMIPVFSFLLKGELLAAVITVVQIGILSLLLYKTSITENFLHIAVIAGYAIACFLSGKYCGRKAGRKRFLWGMIAGMIYYGILLLLSMAILKTGLSTSFIFSALVCAGSGMLGGMMS